MNLEARVVKMVHYQMKRTLPAIQTERFPSGSASESPRSTSIMTSF